MHKGLYFAFQTLIFTGQKHPLFPSFQQNSTTSVDRLVQDIMTREIRGFDYRKHADFIKETFIPSSTPEAIYLDQYTAWSILILKEIAKTDDFLNNSTALLFQKLKNTAINCFLKSLYCSTISSDTTEKVYQLNAEKIKIYDILLKLQTTVATNPSIRFNFSTTIESIDTVNPLFQKCQLWHSILRQHFDTQKGLRHPKKMAHLPELSIYMHVIMKSILAEISDSDSYYPITGDLIRRLPMLIYTENLESDLNHLKKEYETHPISLDEDRNDTSNTNFATSSTNIDHFLKFIVSNDSLYEHLNTISKTYNTTQVWNEIKQYIIPETLEIDSNFISKDNVLLVLCLLYANERQDGCEHEIALRVKMIERIAYCLDNGSDDEDIIRLLKFYLRIGLPIDSILHKDPNRKLVNNFSIESCVAFPNFIANTRPESSLFINNIGLNLGMQYTNPMQVIDKTGINQAMSKNYNNEPMTPEFFLSRSKNFFGVYSQFIPPNSQITPYMWYLLEEKTKNYKDFGIEATKLYYASDKFRAPNTAESNDKLYNFLKAECDKLSDISLETQVLDAVQQLIREYFAYLFRYQNNAKELAKHANCINNFIFRRSDRVYIDALRNIFTNPGPERQELLDKIAKLKNYASDYNCCTSVNAAKEAIIGKDPKYIPKSGKAGDVSEKPSKNDYISPKHPNRKLKIPKQRVAISSIVFDNNFCPNPIVNLCVKMMIAGYFAVYYLLHCYSTSFYFPYSIILHTNIVIFVCISHMINAKGSWLIKFFNNKKGEQNPFMFNLINNPNIAPNFWHIFLSLTAATTLIFLPTFILSRIITAMTLINIFIFLNKCLQILGYEAFNRYLAYAIIAAGLFGAGLYSIIPGWTDSLFVFLFMLTACHDYSSYISHVNQFFKYKKDTVIAIALCCSVVPILGSYMPIIAYIVYCSGLMFIPITAASFINPQAIIGILPEERTQSPFFYVPSDAIKPQFAAAMNQGLKEEELLNPDPEAKRTIQARIDGLNYSIDGNNSAASIGFTEIINKLEKENVVTKFDFTTPYNLDKHIKNQKAAGLMKIRNAASQSTVQYDLELWEFINDFILTANAMEEIHCAFKTGIEIDLNGSYEILKRSFMKIDKVVPIIHLVALCKDKKNVQDFIPKAKQFLEFHKLPTDEEPAKLLAYTLQKIAKYICGLLAQHKTKVSTSIEDFVMPPKQIKEGRYSKDLKNLGYSQHEGVLFDYNALYQLLALYTSEKPLSQIVIDFTAPNHRTEAEKVLKAEDMPEINHFNQWLLSIGIMLQKVSCKMQKIPIESYRLLEAYIAFNFSGEKTKYIQDIYDRIQDQEVKSVLKASMIGIVADKGNNDLPEQFKSLTIATCIEILLMLHFLRNLDNEDGIVNYKAMQKLDANLNKKLGFSLLQLANITQHKAQNETNIPLGLIFGTSNEDYLMSQLADAHKWHTLFKSNNTQFDIQSAVHIICVDTIRMYDDNLDLKNIAPHCDISQINIQHDQTPAIPPKDILYENIICIINNLLSMNNSDKPECNRPAFKANFYNLMIFLHIAKQVYDELKFVGLKGMSMSIVHSVSQTWKEKDGEPILGSYCIESVKDNSEGEDQQKVADMIQALRTFYYTKKCNYDRLDGEIWETLISLIIKENGKINSIGTSVVEMGNKYKTIYEWLSKVPTILGPYFPTLYII